MKRRAGQGAALLLAALLMACGAQALAEYECTGRIHDSLPAVCVRVSDAGERDETRLRENLLRVSIEAEDGGFSQEIAYQSSESASHEGATALARLRDVNFDGYNDLMLLTAQGARNVFYAVSVYDPDARQFLPVLQGYGWNTKAKAFDTQSLIQLELCNEELFPEQGLVCSSVADGYRYLTEIVYQWEGKHSLVPASVVDVYDTGEGMIGELLEQHATRIRRCWDEQYPEEWYYGQEDVSGERRASYRALTVGSAGVDPQFMEVANVDWVNLRRQDSKASPSLAKLTAGTEVQVLSKGCGEDGGWIRVFVWPEGDEPGLTGYIWHSYLRDVRP